MIKTFYDIEPKIEIIAETDHFIIIMDAYPVSPGHMLVVSKEVYTDYFTLPNQQKQELHQAIDLAKKLIEDTQKPSGYNIGMNCGEVSGQTVMHFHCHVIPRYEGDVENPRGGVRHAVIGKGYY